MLESRLNSENEKQKVRHKFKKEIVKIFSDSPDKAVFT